jgi:23S rRNA pseudouridine1911/1915/1917 synthase
MTDPIYLTAIIPENFDGWRLDRTLAEVFPDYSRSSLKNWILEGKVQVDHETVRPRFTVEGGELVELKIEPEQKVEWKPQAISLDIAYEDEDIIVINKPVGLVVHPGAGNPDSTLVNALLHHEPDLENLPRAGIVHRLDKDTSGIMVVARSMRAHTSLIDQLQKRSLKREYQAIVIGTIIAGGKVDAPIGRHPTQRVRMAVVENGKPAVTHFRVETRFRSHTHLRLQLESGRTHQIRVHMTHIGYPIVGDQVYGGRLKLPKEASESLIETLRNFKRQALHSSQLTLEHPGTGESLSWIATLPDDMQKLIEELND